jgi:hypothetical protein
MLTAHRDQEVKSMPKLRDANETSQRHRLSFSLLNRRKNHASHEIQDIFKAKVNKQNKCLYVIQDIINK